MVSSASSSLTSIGETTCQAKARNSFSSSGFGHRRLTVGGFTGQAFPQTGRDNLESRAAWDEARQNA
ncbi:hypothetical protein EB74_31150 [Mycobacterium sp. SWH-M5]|nr:hypothetical protein EB74_31150 [Mycobacterium sp. SWH-M5]